MKKFRAISDTLLLWAQLTCSIQAQFEPHWIQHDTNLRQFTLQLKIHALTIVLAYCDVAIFFHYGLKRQKPHPFPKTLAHTRTEQRAQKP